MACNSATALAQRAGKRMTKICANYPPYLSPPQLPFYRLKKQAKVVTPFVASSLWPFFVPPKNLASADKSPPLNITIPHLNLKGMLHLGHSGEYGNKRHLGTRKN